MKKILFILIALFLIGCSGCKTCKAASLDLGSDLILNMTESNNFKELFLDYANKDLNGLADLIFKVASGSKIPSASNETVTINQAQSNRWFSKSDKNSFSSLIIYGLLRKSVIDRKPFLPKYYLDEKNNSATLHIKDETKRNKFINSLDLIYSSDVDY